MGPGGGLAETSEAEVSKRQPKPPRYQVVVLPIVKRAKKANGTAYQPLTEAEKPRPRYKMKVTKFRWSLTVTVIDTWKELEALKNRYIRKDRKYTRRGAITTGKIREWVAKGNAWEKALQEAGALVWMLNEERAGESWGKPSGGPKTQKLP